MKKRHFIKDPIWGNIELFPWEAKLLNQFLVNRLHNVIQTSCAYLVYPGLKYSRFVHSIGVIHAVTQMFVNLIANSEEKYLSKLSEECRLIEHNFPDTSQMGDFRKTITQRVSCPGDYALLLGTIRTAALLHDIGHLPYSHIFEFALDRFIRNSFSENLNLLNYDLLDEKKLRLEKLHSGLKEIFETNSHFEPIHEVIGQNLMMMLHQRAKETREEFEPFMKGTLQLWVDNELPISKSLLSEDIDADRIDFVNRDGYFSGLFQSSVDFDRLFAFYELAEVQDAKGSIHLLARPSLRASSEGEKLLLERFLDYKYIMAHHKVHLFDELLERLLFLCICDGSMNIILETIMTIAKDLTGLPLIRKKQDILDAERAILNYFNDSWIDVQLMRAYENALAQEDQLLIRLYEGLSERRDLFKSIFKRDEDYFLEGFEFDPEKTLPFLIPLSIKSNKYFWERTLSNELETLIVIGDLSNVLRIGIKDRFAADFLGLTSLRGFLESKNLTSHQFNVWYYSPTGEKQRDIESRILEFVKTQLKELSINEDVTTDNVA